MPNVQDLRRAAGWRDGCPAAGMTAKAVRSGRWLGVLSLFRIKNSVSVYV